MQSWLRPLHDAAGMRAADGWAIDEEGVPSLRLMEAAGTALADAVREVAREGPVRVVCGKGNNGGDGLVAARLLAGWGHEVDVLLLWPGDELSADAATNLERLGFEARLAAPERIAAELEGSSAVVDAIFGTGFSGIARSPAREAIQAINGCGAPVVAADIASGVDASTGEVAGVAVRATLTVSFHAAKLGHRIAPGKGHTGELRVAEIGIPPGDPVEPAGGEVTAAVLGGLPRRGPASTKFTSGQVVIAGGSRGLTGAVCLVATAAIRAGAGYATAMVPASLEPILETKLTEVMTRGCDEVDGEFTEGAVDEVVEMAERAGAFVLGPGMGRGGNAQQTARSMARAVGTPLVLDADGLNAHAGALGSLSARSSASVLTPHEGELARLLGTSAERVRARRLESARAAAREARAIIVLKGDDTLIVDGRDEHPITVSGLASPGLATAGTGDTLSGTIAALIARGVEPFRAACAGVYANQRAGRIAAERIGSAESVIASDVIEALPRALVPESQQAR